MAVEKSTELPGQVTEYPCIKTGELLNSPGKSLMCLSTLWIDALKNWSFDWSIGCRR